MANPERREPQPGDILAGKYRVERVLGVGGMGVVVAAHHIQLDERVALKFLLPQAVDSQEAVARFLREARAAVKIKNEHVARVTDVGQLENGAPYIVMEYLAGSDLSGWLEKHGALPIAQAVDFVLQACEALADAHSLGIVHRDLKPANLFCIQRSDGQLSIKVLDFGISKVMTPDSPGHGMTKTTALMGSPLYMSPEQMQQSKGVDARTDIWALGVILFELLCGRPPFDAEAVTELAIKVAMEPAPSVRAFRADAPPGLERAIARCLEKDRKNRFQTVGELAVALKEFGSSNARQSVERVIGILREAGVATEAVPPSTSPSPAPGVVAPPTGASWGNTNAATKPGSKAAIVGIAAAAVLAVVALGGTMLFLRSSPSTPASAAAAVSPPPVVPLPADPIPTAPAPSPSATPAVTAAVTVAPPASVAAPVTPPPVRQAPRPSAPVRPQPPAAPASAPPTTPPAAKPNCAIPYVIDADGHRQYKPECLN